MENKSVTSPSQIMSERYRLNLSAPSHPDWSVYTLPTADDNNCKRHEQKPDESKPKQPSAVSVCYKQDDTEVLTELLGWVL